MEIWVRSQDKTRLTKAVEIKYQKGLIDDEKAEAIIGTPIYDEFDVLGVYESKERALEVLDEIQDIISFMVCKEVMNYDAEQYMQFDYETLKEIENKGLVYEMPEE